MNRVLVTQGDTVGDRLLARLVAPYGVQLHFCPASAGALLQTLCKTHYDAVVVQTPLPDLRRVSLVQQYRRQYSDGHARTLLPQPEPLFFAVLPSRDEKMRRRLLENGYADVLIMPYSEHRLARAIQDKIGPVRQGYCLQEESLQLYFNSLLLELGVPGHLCGFWYLSECLMCVAAQTSALHQVTKVLYPQVACKMNTTADNLERSMRTAIKRMLENSDRSVIDHYLTPQFGNGQRGSSAISHFLGRLLQYSMVHQSEFAARR